VLAEMCHEEQDLCPQAAEVSALLFGIWIMYMVGWGPILVFHFVR